MDGKLRNGNADLSAAVGSSLQRRTIDRSATERGAATISEKQPHPSNRNRLEHAKLIDRTALFAVTLTLASELFPNVKPAVSSVVEPWFARVLALGAGSDETAAEQSRRPNQSTPA